MKFLAFLFSFYLLFLAIEPGLKAMDIIDGQTTACCSDTQCDPGAEEDGDHPEEQENSSACNPFQFCKCCSFVTHDIKLVTHAPIILFSSAHTDHKENVPPHISLDFWQPPKIG